MSNEMTELRASRDSYDHLIGALGYLIANGDSIAITAERVEAAVMAAEAFGNVSRERCGIPGTAHAAEYIAEMRAKHAA